MQLFELVSRGCSARWRGRTGLLCGIAASALGGVPPHGGLQHFRAEAVWRAEDYFAALAKPLALDADGAGDEEEQPTRDPHTLAGLPAAPHRLAGRAARQLRGEASLAFVPEVTPLLEALEEILNPA